MNTRQQGDIGVAQAIAYYTSLNYVVCFPLTDSARYDLVVDKGTELVRVQIKTGSFIAPSGNTRIELRTSGGNRSGIGKQSKLSIDECDEVFLYDLNKSTFRIFDIRELHGRTSVTI